MADKWASWDGTGADAELAEMWQLCDEIVNQIVNQAVPQDEETGDIPLCAICLGEMAPDDIEASTTLPCGHQFHKECVGSWMMQPRRTSCPVCRFKVHATTRTVLRKDAPKPPKKGPPSKRARMN